MSKHKTNATRRIGTTVITALVLGFLAEGAFASSMRCGGAIISAGGRPAPTQAEVKWRCGEPYSRTGNNWIYVQPNGTVYRVRFNDNGEVRSVTTERLSR
jgi:hypothetical protein